MTINSWNSQDPVQVAKGGSGRASTTAYAVICGGTTSTSSQQSIASVGTSGYVLTSNGAGTLPTFQAFTSNPGSLQITTLTLTSSQIKNIRGTPIEIVPAQGAGVIINPVRVWWRLNYGGNDAFTGTGSIVLCYNSVVTVLAQDQSMTNAAIIDTQSNYCSGISTTTYNARISAELENVNIVAMKSTATEFSGNASNDNTATVSILWYVMAI